SSSSGATNNKDESEVEDKSVKRKRDRSVSNKLSDLKPDLTKQWVSQSWDIRQKLILAITKKLPGYPTINANPKLKAYNRIRIEKNSKINE
ncbi:9300_t:CDS:2, partial [Racocetra fulgida]